MSNHYTLTWACAEPNSDAFKQDTQTHARCPPKPGHAISCVDLAIRFDAQCDTTIEPTDLTFTLTSPTGVQSDLDHTALKIDSEGYWRWSITTFKGQAPGGDWHVSLTSKAKDTQVRLIEWLADIHLVAKPTSTDQAALASL